MRKTKTLTLSESLQAWKLRIAKLLNVDVLWQKEAAALVDIPEKTWKNYEPTTRRQPGALALSELMRRLDEVEEYIKSGRILDVRLTGVIEEIKAARIASEDIPQPLDCCPFHESGGHRERQCSKRKLNL